MRIKQRGLNKKSNDTSSFLHCVASLYENLTLKKHQIVWAKNSARKNLERERTNKSQAISARDTGDLFYQGSAFEGLVPVEESTKDGSLSTLSLFLHRSPKTGELFFFSRITESCLEGGWIGKLKLFQQKLEANWVKLNWSWNSPS
jgi:hypothetical protein